MTCFETRALILATEGERCAVTGKVVRSGGQHSLSCGRRCGKEDGSPASLGKRATEGEGYEYA